jgi:hypothetical protein
MAHGTQAIQQEHQRATIVLAFDLTPALQGS